jgi:cytoskeletal protein RodZ
MKRFGEELKYSRESRGISLQDISKDTRINQKFIEAIEEGNFGVLPQTYIRAFIRAYAKYIGLNPNETITRYEQYALGKVAEEKPKNQKLEKSSKPEKSVEQEGEKEIIEEPVQRTPIKQLEDYLTQVKPSEPTEPIKSYTDEESKTHIKYPTSKPKVNYTALFIIIAAIIIVVVFVILNLPAGKEKEPERTSFDNVLKETEKKYSSEVSRPVKDSVRAVLPKSDSLTLGVISDVDVWINVRMDKDKFDRGMLTANTKKYLRAKEKFIVTASKGRKIKIYLDEKYLGNLSQSDSLKSASVSLEGLKTLKLQKKPSVQKSDLKMLDLKPLDPKLP